MAGQRIAVNLDLARGGYLTRDDGVPRPIRGLDQITADLAEAGVQVYWSDLHGDCPGMAYYRAGRIVLARWLWDCVPFFIRRVLSEELGHCLLGGDEDRVQHWQEENYGELLEPPWTA